VAFWLAHWARSQFTGSVTLFGFNLLSNTVGISADYNWMYVIIGFFSPLILELQGFYTRPWNPSRRLTAWMLLKSCFLTTITVILVLYMSRIVTPRGVIMLFGPISFLLVYFKEELIRLSYNTGIGQAQFKRRVILIGTAEDTARLQTEISAKSQDEIEIVREFDLNETSIDTLLNFLHEHSVNGVIINAKHTFFGKVEKAILACELEGVETWLVADFFKTQISRTSFDDFYGRPILVFHSGPENSWQAVLKQFLDLVGALALLVLTSPLFLFSAIAIKLTSPGPILFKQKRSGLNGQPFTMYKFRSMVTNAEQRQHEILSMNEMTGPVFKVTNDPRITPIGNLLRKLSIDELPQLFNVLRGEMSLVGPRPLPVDEVKRFDDFAHRRRLSVKPGLTCLWQVKGRNNVTNFKDWVRLDLEYIDNWSIWLDIKILWWTIPVVLFAKGAK
jgi:exopolysaccharide biosynthesis polyprenyl glycosylphosphotransferase